MNRPAFLPHDWYPEPLPPNVVIGARSWLYSSFAFRHYRSRRPVGVRIGRDTGVYNGSFFDLGKNGEVEIGDFCTLVGAVIASDGQVIIGDYAFLAHEVVLADGFAAVPPVNDNEEEEHADVPIPGIYVGENSWIGARAVLISGAHIGRGAIVAAAAVVDFAVPPYAIVAGNPARVVGWSGPV